LSAFSLVYSVKTTLGNEAELHAVSRHLQDRFEQFHRALRTNTFAGVAGSRFGGDTVDRMILITEVMASDFELCAEILENIDLGDSRQARFEEAMECWERGVAKVMELDGESDIMGIEEAAGSMLH
jgi:hypothetical protein